MEVNFERVVPVLRIFDIDKAREFYVDYLGFSVDWQHRFDEHSPLYMQVSRGARWYCTSRSTMATARRARSSTWTPKVSAPTTPS